MAAEHWFRWHHGTVTDPKWRVIASRCVTNVTVGHIIAVWAAMVENASQASPRGQLSGWDDEDVAVCLGFTIEQVSCIRQAMQGKVLDGDSLSGWEKRQPNREDRSTERTRAWRERQRDDGDDKKRSVTQCDAAKRTVTLETETETEENREEQKQKTGAPAVGSRLPADWRLPPEWRSWAAAERPELDVQAQADSFADYWHGIPGAKGRKADWLGTWRNWIRRADEPRRSNGRSTRAGDIFAGAQ